MNQTMIRTQQHPSLIAPLSEIRQQIEIIHEQILYAKPTPQELLDDLQHDMRTPIGNILACITLMQMDGELTEAQQEMIEIIQQSAKTMVGKLDHLLQFSA